MRGHLLLSSVLAGSAPVTAYAQAQPVTVPPAQDPASQSQATEERGPAAPTDAIADIVVTAQKRAERIQDVPIAITVVDGEALTRSGAKNLTELQGVAPGIFVSGNSGYGGSPISIRGTAGTNSQLLDDPVAVYVNGVYQASGTFGGTSLLDIGSIEIVRGPQGTLQGRNATAGAVLVRTADPTSDLGGYIRGSIASPFEARGEAAIGGPVSSTLGIREPVERDCIRYQSEQRALGQRWRHQLLLPGGQLQQAAERRHPIREEVLSGSDMTRRLIDMSVSIENGAVSDPPMAGSRVICLQHHETVARMATSFPGRSPNDFSDQEGWAAERMDISTHDGTHMDAPWDFHLTQDAALPFGSRRSMTIDEPSDIVVVDTSAGSVGGLARVQD